MDMHRSILHSPIFAPRFYFISFLGGIVVYICSTLFHRGSHGDKVEIEEAEK